MTHAINGRYVTPEERAALLTLQPATRTTRLDATGKNLGHVTKGHAQGQDLFEAADRAGNTITYLKLSNAESWLETQP